MKRIIQNYGWVLMILFFMAMLAAMYRIVDTPETIGAKENPYAIPQEVIDASEACGAEFHIAPELLQAIAWHESRYIPTVVNKNGDCFGLMQIKQSVHADRMQKLGVGDLFNLYGNMRVAADYLLELCTEHEDIAYVLMIYHGESDAEWKYNNGLMSDYASGILDMAYELEELHGKHVNTMFKTFDWAQGVG